MNPNLDALRESAAGDLRREADLLEPAGVRVTVTITEDAARLLLRLARAEWDRRHAK